MTERVLYAAAAPFEAARRVDVLPPGHRARRLHGHGFLARVRADLPDGWVQSAGSESDALRESLNGCVSTLDYDSLNNHLEVPTDENLARWLGSCLHVPGIEALGIQSTHHQGADLDRQGHIHVWRRYRFESAHQLPNVPQGHKCGRMHGHGFEIILHADQNLGDRYMGVDYDYLDRIWEPIHRQLDHACLNDIPGLENPTSEMLAAWIWQRLKPALPLLSWITVYETVTAGCHFDGDLYRIWKDQRFESAMRLQRAAHGDPRRRLHGHSYLLRLHLTAELDPVMGWTLDYGDVKSRFKPVYKALDHHVLDELEGVEDTDPASLTRWIRQRTSPVLPQLDRIDLYQTPGCGAILSWGAEGPALPT